MIGCRDFTILRVSCFRVGVHGGLVVSVLFSSQMVLVDRTFGKTSEKR